MTAILIVCTGNVCRSPIAEGLLRRALAVRLGSDVPSVSSAGTAGWEGSGAQPGSIEAAADRGVDITDHVARQLTREQVLAADLVLGMAVEHRTAVARVVPEAASRTFTLKELVRLLEALPEPDPSEPDPSDGTRLANRVHQADTLRRNGFEGNPFDEDVVDPLGHPPQTFHAVAWELDGWCTRLVDGLLGPAPNHHEGEA